MEKFKKGDIVWAKIRGYPWWPGMVAHIEDGSDEERDPKILVNFIGDNSHAELPLNKISNFEENLKEYSKSKKKDLLDSIELAQKIKSGETSYEEELVKVEKRDRSKNSLKKKRGYLKGVMIQTLQNSLKRMMNILMALIRENLKRLPRMV